MSDTPAPIAVSVVIATYQAAETLERCLDSVIAQQGVDWELLVVDGASTDGTVAVLERYREHLAWWHSAPDLGLYDAWNRAIPRTRGVYLTFLGADDALAGSLALARLLPPTGLRPDLISSRGMLMPSGRVFGEGWDYRKLGRRMPLCHPGLLHHRSLFERHGLFDPQFRITGDLDFLLRLPADTSASHVDAITTLVGESGISRRQLLVRLREQRLAMARCPRIGPARAWLAWADKLWRLPIARLLNLSY